MGDEPHVGQPVGAELPANRRVRGLDRARVERAAAVEAERDPAVLERCHDLRRRLRVDPSELDPCRQREHVGREAVSSLVRRAPQPAVGHVTDERVVGTNAVRAAAGVAARMRADEHERVVDDGAVGLRIDVEDVFRMLELAPSQRSSFFGRDPVEDDRGAARPPRPPDEQHPSLERREVVDHRMRKVRAFDRVPAPGRSMLQQQPPLRPGRGARERDSRGTRQRRTAHRVDSRTGTVTTVTEAVSSTATTPPTTARTVGRVRSTGGRRHT